MKQGIPGVYTRRLSVTCTDVAAHRRLSNYITLYVRRHSSDHWISPLSLSIIQSAPPLAVVPCFLLAWTCCRINEIDQISIPVLKTMLPIQIASSKSDNVKTIEPLRPFNLLQLRSIPDSTPLIVISYDALCGYIDRAKSLNHMRVKSTRLDVTHIFRHLQASHFHAQGWSRELISERLGHNSLKTTSQYIHDISSFTES